MLLFGFCSNLAPFREPKSHQNAAQNGPETKNEDKKQDQQRYLVWFSALSVTAFIIVLMTPLIPMERIDHLSGIAEIWVLSNMGVIGSFIGFNQIAKRRSKHDEPIG